MADISIKQQEWEADQEALRKKALSICSLYADLVPLDKACKLEGISPAAFFSVKRNNPDIQRAFIEAKEVQAELRLSQIDDMENQVLAGELDKDLFSVVIKSKQWSITKLRPDLFGNKTTIDVSGTIEHSPAKALAKLTDEQILQIAQIPQTVQDPQTVCTEDTEDTSGKDQPAVLVDAVFEEVTETTDKNIDTQNNLDYNIKEGGSRAPSQTESTLGVGSKCSKSSLPEALDLKSFGGWQ